jgi:hypothetical protein
MKRYVGIFAVDLGSRSGKNELAFLARGFQDSLRAVDVGLDGANGALDDQFDADSGRKMNHGVGIVHELRYQLAVFNVVQMIFHALKRFQMTNVIHASGGQIVEQNDAIAAVQQTLREVRTDETRAASD